MEEFKEKNMEEGDILKDVLERNITENEVSLIHLKESRREKR